MHIHMCNKLYNFAVEYWEKQHVLLQWTSNGTRWRSLQYSFLTDSKDDNVLDNCAKHMCAGLWGMAFLIRPDLLQKDNEQGDG